MYQESEIVDLLMVVFLTPIMYASVRAIHIPGKRWFVAAYLSIAVGYVLTILEGYVAPDALNFGEHVTHAVAGVCFLVASAALFRSSRPEGGRA